jgi:hypothetical protein
MPAHPVSPAGTDSRAADRYTEIVANLRWCSGSSFYRRFDATLGPGLRVLPHAPSPPAAAGSHPCGYRRIRHLRNRIAHHEPLLERDIGADLAAIGRLIHARCPHTLGWLQRHERATTVLAASPLAAHR